VSPYISTKDTALYLGVSKSRVRHLERDGKILRPKEVPRGYFTRKSVEAYKLKRDSRGLA
jgi:hypothetical protein